MCAIVLAIVVSILPPVVSTDAYADEDGSVHISVVEETPKKPLIDDGSGEDTNSTSISDALDA